MRYINSAIFIIAILVFSNLAAVAQETEAVVVDQVVAQVNEGVITLSQVKREINEIIDTSVKEGKTPEQARSEVEARQGELIANIINEQLILQRGKEMGVDSDVEAEINRRFLDIMKQQDIKSLEVLYKEMEKGGIDPKDIRELWRKQIVRDMVMRREVDSKLYYSWSPKEIKAYYEANKTKFTKPATITISEIFLSFAGRDKDVVRAKAKDIVAQARGGADFAKLAEENSDRPNVKQTRGKVPTLTVEELDKTFAEPLKNVRVGGVSEPVEIPEEGIEILRVDERTNASSESVFNEDAVRNAMTYEKIPEERKKFMTTLRRDAYIKISEAYRPIVSPILFADDRKAEVKKSEK